MGGENGVWKHQLQPESVHLLTSLFQAPSEAGGVSQPPEVSILRQEASSPAAVHLFPYTPGGA